MHKNGMNEYKEDDYLQLSGIQHFAFCRRQWALIHIEKQWAENYRTTDGALMHEKAHDPDYSESRKNLYTVRGLHVFSPSLGVSGECDVVEFRLSPDGVTLPGKEGKWLPFPVEYKRGEPKDGDCDALQLCGQAMCLEEMLCCRINSGALYYGKTRRRTEVGFTEEMREQVRKYLEEMHELYRRGFTPRVRPFKGCNACSLKESCLPVLCKNKSVAEYLSAAAQEGK